MSPCMCTCKRAKNSQVSNFHQKPGYVKGRQLAAPYLILLPAAYPWHLRHRNKLIWYDLHTVVTAKVNGTVTEIARDKTKTKSSCRTLPLIPACEQMINNWDTAISALQATFIHIWISPVRYLLPMPSSGSSRRRQKRENEPDAGDKKEKQPKILRF